MPGGLSVFEKMKNIFLYAEKTVGGKRRGQSLIEILIAVAIGALMITAAAAIITPVLRINTQSGRMQVSATLAKELVENVRVWAEGDWHNVFNLATSSVNHYYLLAASSPFASSSGDESISVSTTTYTRYFYVDDVSRDAGGKIVSGVGTNDPSIKKITVIYGWSGGTTSSLAIYLTRNANKIFSQTDWSGGSGVNGPVTSTVTTYASSTSLVTGTSTPGSLLLGL